MESPIPLPVDRANPFDPPHQIRLQHEKAPVTRLSYPDGHLGWLVTSHLTSRKVLVDGRFSNRQELRHISIPGEDGNESPAAPGMFLRTDPPVHTRYRRMLTSHFSSRRMRAFTPEIERIVHTHLTALRGAGGPVDLVEEFAVPVSLTVICELLGIPPSHRDRFRRSSELAADASASADQRAGAFSDIAALLSDVVAMKRADPVGGILGELAEAGTLTGTELANITLLLLVVGHDTTASMLALGTFALLRHPDQREAFARSADPAERVAAVEELLRYLTIIQFGTVRTALEDVDLDGVRISAGESVTVSLPAANRDPHRFPDPDRLDLSRNAAGHVAFGYGTHQCLGQHLARIELQVGLTELFQRFPGLRLAVPADRVPLRSRTAVYGLRALPVTW